MFFYPRSSVTGGRSAYWLVLDYVPWSCLKLGSVFMKLKGCFELILSGFGPLGSPGCQLRSVFSYSMPGLELLQADPHSG